MDENTAKNGVYIGKYYASIHIPEDFSERLTSFLTDHPEKPTLVYSVNEKLNAIVPNITKKGVETVRDTIESSFISALYAEIFEKLNLTAEKIQSQQHTIARARALLDDIIPKMGAWQEKLQDINHSLGHALEVSDTLL